MTQYMAKFIPYRHQLLFLGVKRVKIKKQLITGVRAI